jgi:virginiamycin B lyase
MFIFTRPVVLRLSVILAFLLAWGAQFYAPQVAAAADPVITEYPLPPGASGPEGITAGPDGNLWVAQEFSNQIARVSPTDGSATEFLVPVADTLPITQTAPLDITRGPDNNLWFAMYAPIGQIGKVSVTGVFTKYNLPKKVRLWGVAVGPDNNIWFTEYDNAMIGRIDVNGQNLHEFPISAASFPAVITRGPDNAMWFTEEGGNQIGRIDMSGNVQEFPIPGPGPHGPCGITTGPDGNIWFAEQDGDKIGRITIPGHVMTEYPLPANSGPIEMVGAPDGNVWVALGGVLDGPNPILNDKVAKVAMDGTITEYSVPTPASVPYGMGLGPDHNVWFTEDATGTVGVIRLTPIVYSHHTYLPVIMR